MGHKIRDGNRKYINSMKKYSYILVLVTLAALGLLNKLSQRSGIVDPYSYFDCVTLGQSRPLAAVSKRLAPQLNDLATPPSGGVNV